MNKWTQTFECLLLFDHTCFKFDLTLTSSSDLQINIIKRDFTYESKLTKELINKKELINNF